MFSFMFGILCGLIVGALAAIVIGGVIYLLCMLFVAVLNVFAWIRGE